ncbi:DoxX family protein [Gluconobacter sp. Dm-62]|uniref:DoxX family protein n=1 Tax=Gluconobacter sp. Dm-62 TaxID=2799804 RepID=UPI001B8C7F1B|nr:DoxX family protein [Gluconobacter sp. Dm-62]MBS1102104.1 DoxX family protein [Gluconobacter sp. Dm-62]
MNTSFPRDQALFASRILLASLFVLMGWSKLTGFEGTVGYMASTGAPVPTISAVIAIVTELGIGLALVAGFLTTPLSILLAVYTIVTAFIGHHYWTFTGMVRYDMWIHFYKNFSIAGGLLALASAGAGRFSLDARRK